MAEMTTAPHAAQAGSGATAPAAGDGPARPAPALRPGGGAAQADVVVIGAGLAGLSAARHLKRHGASVLVLEARGRFGGRVHSQRLDSGHMIDLGAQFIGDAQLHVSALADEAGLHRVPAVRQGDVLHVLPDKAGPLRLARDRLPLSLLDGLDALQTYWRLERAVARLAPGDRERLDSVTAASFIRARSIGEPAFRTLGGHIENELCTSLDSVSAYEMLEQGASIGGFAGETATMQWFLAEGAEGMTRFLANEIGPSLILNSAVHAVSQDKDGVAVFSAAGQYRAGHVVVAIPPQLYGAIGLLPVLPALRRRVIAGFRHGAVVKTILVFDAPWWRDSGLSGTIMSPGSTFSAAVDGSPADGNVGILVLFSTARGATTLGKRTIEAERVAEAMRWLHHAHGAPAPEPVAARSVNWSADPFSLGGYASRRGIGGWCAVPDLFAPFGRLHFAGSETATRWRSFMDGAIQSGLRAAREILGPAGLSREGTPANGGTLSRQ